MEYNLDCIIDKGFIYAVPLIRGQNELKCLVILLSLNNIARILFINEQDQTHCHHMDICAFVCVHNKGCPSKVFTTFSNSVDCMKGCLWYNDLMYMCGGVDTLGKPVFLKKYFILTSFAIHSTSDGIKQVHFDVE